MATENSGDLNAFHQFVGAHLETDVNLTPDEVIDRWRALHPSEEEMDEVEALVQEALDDLAAGGRCISSAEFEQSLEREFGLKPPNRRS